ncbi:hypothetical protein E2C01_067859 [Portunus trituberculatus]|uniref:Uncharacterized protein n=1 Tax=Portunus trituberculatus TaxID=210409 RepID=A0A5B7HUZ1_PORTR|nr:hypothetical protein [Portunus trituberculatus]
MNKESSVRSSNIDVVALRSVGGAPPIFTLTEGEGFICLPTVTTTTATYNYNYCYQYHHPLRSF